MKKLEAVVRPHLLEAVKNALQEVGVVGMTISEVKGYGRQKGHSETYRGSEYKVELVPKVKIEVALPEEMVESAMDAVLRTAKTGKFGDGKVFVTSLEDVEAQPVKANQTIRRGQPEVTIARLLNCSNGVMWKPLVCSPGTKPRFGLDGRRLY